MISSSMSSEHRIHHLRIHVIRLPVNAVHSQGSGDVNGINSVILEIVTDSGITGWGEASPWPVFTGSVEANAYALHNHIGPSLVGEDPFRVTKHLFTADKAIVGCTEAKAALEMALMDIVGKVSGLSVAELLGGRCRETIPLSFSVANPDFEKDLEDIARLHEDGVRLFKLKTGFDSHESDLSRLERLRKRYSETIGLRVDYNQGLPAFDAVRRLRDIETMRLDFIEQPVKRHERAALADITRKLDTPVMADESVFSPQEAIEAVEMRLADVISLKVMKSGGIRRSLAIASIAETAGMDVYGGCMFETGLAHAAGVHLMASIPSLNLGCEYYMATYYVKEDILAEPFQVRNGHVHVPTGPGLGVAVDRDVLARYRLELLE